MEDIYEAIDKVIMGPQKKSRLVTEVDKRITAYHEGGHAIVAKKLAPYCDPVQEISIIPRGNAAGYTMSRPDNDDDHITYKKLTGAHRHDDGRQSGGRSGHPGHLRGRLGRHPAGDGRSPVRWSPNGA